MTKNYKCNLYGLRKLALEISAHAVKDDVIALFGELGTGKTTFAKYFINSFVADEVTSPTFNLLNLYYTEQFTIWHFDLYRLTNIEEIYDLGIEDAFNDGLTIIEWPELIENILPKSTIRITIKNSAQDSMRLIKVQKQS